MLASLLCYQGEASCLQLTDNGASQLCTWMLRSLGCAELRCPLLQGLYAKMVEAFKKMGLEVVPGVGTPFDPEVCDSKGPGLSRCVGSCVCC